MGAQAVDPADQEHLALLRSLKARRLRELEKQAAELGRSTPPEIRTEIVDLRRELRVVEPILTGRLGEDTLAALRSFGVPSTISEAIGNFDARLELLEQRFGRIEVALWVLVVVVAVFVTFVVTQWLLTS